MAKKGWGMVNKSLRQILLLLYYIIYLDLHMTLDQYTFQFQTRFKKQNKK